MWSPDELAAAAAAFDADGFQLHIHAIGDAGVRAALDAVEQVTAVNGPRDRRPVIAHTQVVDPADLPRFAELGVVANLEPLWAQLDPLQVDAHRCRGSAPTAGRLAVPDGVAARLRRRAVDGQRLAGQLATGRSRGSPSRSPGRPRTASPRGGWLPHQRLPVGVGAVGLHPGRSPTRPSRSTGWGTVDRRRAAPTWCGWTATRTTTDPAGWPRIAVRGTWLAGRRTWAA